MRRREVMWGSDILGFGVESWSGEGLIGDHEKRYSSEFL